ncbi:tRNA-splicing endonuclease catalytic subunit Sen34 [Schizosaccharomyces japonicus yFS275]|uniref:tRNA-splicing endonuclease subunit Sen34 n=1 Tax=Schizosaccharomyces japonicus (strain yFS275 / FY16936) TaxID=402676 RepID=B6K069_SCHJY|nr:tRNA-splicing endonuclease catalytic subunit Sen34 [Schizosaccharomyces japonicus yFS275]EEB06219.1 tRNA-splicing endonuclease catalytic subunit Sen34 [Schizosaccharomyces japonicus yFS275]
MPPYPIACLNGQYLLFDLEAVKEFRCKYGILGMLTGTLAQLPQQNVFLGLPVQLMNEEAYYLVKHGLAYLVDDVASHESTRAEITKYHVEQVHTQRRELAQEQHTENNRRQYEKKRLAMQKLGRPPPPEPSPAEDRRSDLLMVPVRTASNRELYAPQDSHIFPEVEMKRYHAFEYLLARKFCLNPGLRFGCHFVAYPGDSLRYHSHYLVNSYNWNEEVPVVNIIAGGRLGTGVKKAWLMCGTKSSSSKRNDTASTRCFSVEWAGFG